MDLSVITTASYASAAVVNGLLLLLLLISWRGRLQGGLLLGAVSLTIISATSSAWHANSGAPALPTVLAFDNLRLGAWALFIVSLLKTRAELAGNINGILRWAMPGILIIYFGLASVLLWQPDQWAPGNQAPLPGPLLLGTIFVIWLIEQLYRNSSTPDKWAIKYLCMGVAGIVIFDAVLYIDALLFQQINPHTWAARGFVQAISTPLIAISATRNPSWEVRVFVSRGVVFFTSSLLVTGGYLVLVAGAGYFLKIFGGDWGDTLLATLVFAALLGLTVLLSSAHLRGLTKQIITRNFYRNKYEYRDEWLKLTSRLAITEGGSSEEIALSAIRELLDSPGGALWSVDNHGRWRQTCCYEWPIDSTSLELTEPVLEQLHNQGNIINLSTMATSSESTPHSAAPAWPESLMNGKQPWLLIPLNSNGKL
ncbi:MAG: XrtA/PEP-CTERM system histidine kinase PrsK, partial [Gammaproteobacteria bacterium]